MTDRKDDMTGMTGAAGPTGFDGGIPSLPNFDVPDHLGYSTDHVWVDSSLDPVVIGVTAFAADRLGDLVYVDMPKVGTRVEAGDEVAELESSKSVEPLVCPVSGVVAYVNKAVADDPEVVNSDPYGEGWILKVELDDDGPELLDAQAYVALTRQASAGEPTA